MVAILVDELVKCARDYQYALTKQAQQGDYKEELDEAERFLNRAKQALLEEVEKLNK